MMIKSFDVSNKDGLIPLATVIEAVKSTAALADTPLFLVGAAARDLWLTHINGIPCDRATEDIDFAVMVNNWTSFEELRGRLLSTGEFEERSSAPNHRLRHRSGLPLDIVPFGGIERADRTIAWPPDQTTVFNCFGMKEALASCSAVHLPAGVDVDVPSISALALLKIQAWQDRKYSAPGKGASDFINYARHYLDCGKMDYATEHHPDLFNNDDFDYEVASAQLLARDVSPLLDESALKRIRDILTPEVEANGSLLMARQSGHDVERARNFIAAFCDQLAVVRA